MKRLEAAVIITVYNKEKYLRSTIESVLSQQTTRPFCIILSDDFSTDSSRSICAAYASRYHLPDGSANDAAVPSNVSTGAFSPEFDAAVPSNVSADASGCCCVVDVTDGVHRGVAGNFLHCLKHALSLNVRYISQIDSDDVLADPAFLDRQISFLESHPDAQAAASGFFMISEGDDLDSARHAFSNSVQTSSVSAPYKLMFEKTPGMAGKGIYARTEYLLTHNNPLSAGGVTYKAEHLKDFLPENMELSSEHLKNLLSSEKESGEHSSEHEVYISSEDATQDLPLWLYLSLFGSFYSCATSSLGTRDLPESASRSQSIESQLKFQKSSLDIRLRFIEALRHGVPAGGSGDRGCADSSGNRDKILDRLASRANLLYLKKMLRHYAKLSPKGYPGKLKESLRKNPGLLLSKDLWRSLAVWIKNM